MVIGLVRKSDKTATAVQPAAVPAQTEKRVSFPGSLQEPGGSGQSSWKTTHSENFSASAAACRSRTSVQQSKQQSPHAETALAPEDRVAQTGRRAPLSGRSSRKLLSAQKQCEQAQLSSPDARSAQPAAWATAGESPQRARLMGRSSKKLLQTSPGALDSEPSTPAAVPEHHTPMLNGTMLSTASKSAHMSGRSSSKLLRPVPAFDLDMASPAAPGPDTFRAMLAGKSSRRLLSVAAVSADTEALIQAPDAAENHAASSNRARLTDISSRRLLSVVAAVDAASQPESPAAPAGAANSSRARLTGKSSRRLMSVASVDLESELASPAADVSSPAADFRARLAGKSSRKLLNPHAAAESESEAATPGSQTSAAARARLIGRSSKKLLLSAAADLDSEASSPATSDVNTQAGFRAMLIGKSSRKLLLVEDTDSEAGTPCSSRYPNQGFNAGGAVGSPGRAKLAGRSSRKLLRVSSTDTGSELSHPATADAGPAAASFRGLLAGRSSRKLLQANSGLAAAEAVAAASPGQVSAADRSAQLAGKSSRKLLLVDRSSTTGPTASDLAEAVAGTFAGQTGRPGSGYSRQNSSRALLAGRSSRKLLMAAAVTPADEASDSEDEADTVVQVLFTDPASSKGLGSQKAAAAAECGTAASCKAMSLQALPQAHNPMVDISSLALLLSNAADKDVLLDAVSELQALADSDPALPLMIVQNGGIVQGLCDLLDDTDLDLQLAAVALIKTLAAAGPESQASLGHYSCVISGLVDLLHRADKAVKANAAVALWALASDNPRVQGKVGSKNGVKLVQDLCAMMQEPTTGSFAAGLTWTLVNGHKDNQALFAGVSHEGLRLGGVMEPLLMLMEYGAQEEQEYASGALQALITGNARVLKEAKFIGVGERVRRLLGHTWPELY